MKNALNWFESHFPHYVEFCRLFHRPWSSPTAEGQTLAIVAIGQ
jgi:hypothetical protein